MEKISNIVNKNKIERIMMYDKMRTLGMSLEIS